MAASLLCGTSALAQVTDSKPVGASNFDAAAQRDEGGGLTEIIVTAQHRIERRQDVPVSVQVIEGGDLAQHNLTSLGTVSLKVPSVQVGFGSSRGANLYIRGIGSGSNQSFDQSVGIYTDDVYHGRSRTSAGTFLDLERMEILKGPQSTFFGNNSIAGAFNIVTKKPDDVFGGWARALISPNGDSGGQFALEGAVNSRITDTLNVRVAGTFNGQRGWLENIVTGKFVPRERNAAGRLTLAFAPSDLFDATLKLEVSNSKSTGGLISQTDNCPPPAPFTPRGFCAISLSLGLPNIDTNKYSVNDGGYGEFNNKEAVLNINYHIGDHVLTAVTAYYKSKYYLQYDGDGTPVHLLNLQNPEVYDQFSQEIRLTSPDGNSLEYIVGAYFQSDQLFYETDLNFGNLSSTITSSPALAALVPFLPIGQVSKSTQNERILSAFGSLTWKVTDKLRLTGGGRISHVRKSFVWDEFYAAAPVPFGVFTPLPANLNSLPSILGIGSVGSVNLSRSDNAFMPSAKLQYHFSRDVMAYASYSRGFKAGGFNGADNTAIAANFPFNPEHVNSYEVGLKSELFDRHVLFNLAAFRSDYSDLQVSINQFLPNGVGFTIVRNAARSRSQGVELESKFIVSPWLSLEVAGSYLDTKYVSYPNASPTDLQKFNGLTFQDLSGHRTPFAPKWSGSATALFTAPLPGGYKAITEVEGLFATGYDTRGNDDPLLREDGYVRLDARLGFEDASGKWAFDIIGKNLTNAQIITFAAQYPSSLGSRSASKQQPRNVAFQVRYKW
ncbi:TonB-dependent receptor (plasmid) [Sphingobium sp. TKS]|nr:TonB-dependent receptor [Sphingobium sp. TKS]